MVKKTKLEIPFTNGIAYTEWETIFGDFIFA